MIKWSEGDDSEKESKLFSSDFTIMTNLLSLLYYINRLKKQFPAANFIKEHALKTIESVPYMEKF